MVNLIYQFQKPASISFQANFPLIKYDKGVVLTSVMINFAYSI